MSLMGSAAASLGDFDKFSGTNPLIVPAAVSGGLVTMPLWIETLRAWSEVAADLAPLGGVLIMLVTLYKAAMAGSPGAHAQKRKVRATLRDNALAFSKKGGVVAVAALAILALAAVATHFVKPRRDSLPLTIVSAIPSTRKRSSDEAGDDGESDEYAVDGAPPWYVELLRMKGTHEGTQRKPNPLVSKMFVDAGFSDYAKKTTTTPWCAVGVNAALIRSGLPGTGSMMARSFLKYGVALDKPRVGCICVGWRGKSDDGVTGHVFLYAGETDTHILGLGCNQSDTINVAKFPKSRILKNGYRWPRQTHELRTFKGAVTAAASAAGSAVATAVVVADQAAAVRPALEKVGTEGAVSLAAKIAFACAVVGAIAAVYAAVRRVKDHFNKP